MKITKEIEIINGTIAICGCLVPHLSLNDLEIDFDVEENQESSSSTSLSFKRTSC